MFLPDLIGNLPTMTVHVHRASRTDQLADALGELLAAPVQDPFAREIVVVPTRGVERWLAQRLSHRLGATSGQAGVCAGIDFVNPRALFSLLLDREARDPWSPARLVWDVVAVIDDSVAEPWADVLARHLAGAEHRRWSVADKTARLLTEYVEARPAMIADWTAGGFGDGLGHDLPTDQRWQPEVWRRVVARLEARGDGPAPHLRLADAAARLRRHPAPDLPERISLFGHTRFSAADTQLLAGLARHHQVHLWLPQTSPVLWERLRGGPVNRGDDDSARLVGHPLLASLGRDAREVRRSLDPILIDATDEVIPPPRTPETLLGWLQADLRANQVADPATRSARTPAPHDRSVQVHACHGPSRQVEVVRDVVVGLMADDPTLEPRDIVVMCPDIETYGPLVGAAFGLAEAGAGQHPAHRLWVRLADRATTVTNPVVRLARRLLELVTGRATVADVLDLLADPLLARRFRFDDSDHARIAGWAEAAEVRWGLDAEHRGGHGMGAFEVNTWEFGLRRMAAGVAVADDLREVAALEDMPSDDLDLVGRLAEAYDRIRVAVTSMTDRAPADRWAQTLIDAVGSLCELDPDDQWQMAALESEMATMATDADPGTLLGHADLVALLEARFGPRPTRASFRTGALTVATLTPMRSVPHRVVAVVGLDDGAFPRGSHLDGDDVLAQRPLTGERDRRSEDRQLLLDAIGSATETLVLSYSGASELTGVGRPAAVPLGELIEAVDATTDTTLDVVHHHRLQPFNPDELRAEAPFSFDPAAYAGALAARHPTRVIQGPFSAIDVAPEAPQPDSLEDLRSFYSDPVATFVRNLRIRVPSEADPAADQIATELVGLARWQVGERLLRAALVGPGELARACEREPRLGIVPPGAFGRTQIRDVRQIVDRILEAAAPGFGSGRPADAVSIDIELDLGDGLSLVGQVPGVYDTRQIATTFSRVAAKQQLRSWIDTLVLMAARPDLPWTGHLIGRSSSGVAHVIVTPDPAQARARLRTLVRIWHEGLRHPLPLPLKTSLEWARAEARGRDPERDAADAWLGARFGGAPGENTAPAHVLVYGDRAPLSRLTGDQMPRLARDVWVPMLDSQRIEES
ncbi:exodeoxyribonuclease V subunit gamma [soil metagenome]